MTTVYIQVPQTPEEFLALNIDERNAVVAKLADPRFARYAPYDVLRVVAEFLDWQKQFPAHPNWAENRAVLNAEVEAFQACRRLRKPAATSTVRAHHGADKRVFRVVAAARG